MSFEDYLVQQMKINRIESALEKSGNYYTQRQLELALEWGQQALDEANQLGIPNIIAFCQSNIGIVLMQLGRLQRALIAFSSIFAKNNEVIDQELYIEALIRYAEIAQQVPISLQSIENVYMMAEKTIQSSENPHFRHEVLVMRAQCSRFRGDYSKSLEYSQEAWALKKLNPQDLGQVDDFHLDGLISAALELQQLNLAKRYLAEWDTRPDEMPQNRLVRQNRCRAEIAFADGNYSLAIEYGARALSYAKQSDYEETLVSTYITLGKIYFETGMLDEMQNIICDILRFRSCERSYIRYYVFLLIGNYHQLQLITRQSDHIKNKAFLLYQKAQRIGRTIDEALDTSLYFQITQHHMNRLNNS